MSVRGPCYDNVAMEKWNHNLIVDAVHGERLVTRDEARKQIFEYFDDYNRQRPHSILGCISKVDFELSCVARPSVRECRGKIIVYQGERLMLVVLKPVLWSPNGYQGPAGNRKKGPQFADEMGFALEEWNASSALNRRVKLNGSWYRAFHAEPVPAAARHPGTTTIFMYASNGGQQYLVGVAARAINVVKESPLIEPLSMAMKQTSQDMAKQAWKAPGVCDRFESLEEFRTRVTVDDYRPGWVCPVEYFFWLDKPAVINVKQLTGKKKLVTEYRGSQHATIDMASQLLRLVPTVNRNAIWERIALELFEGESSSADDIQSVIEQYDAAEILETTRKALVNARLGQGQFRTDVLAKWNNACAVSGVATLAALRASHIRPWSACKSNKERLDAYNGIPLVASLDALFDKYLISFDKNGKMLVSPSVPAPDRPKLGVGGRLRLPLHKDAAEYMAQHREIFEARKKTLAVA